MKILLSFICLIIFGKGKCAFCISVSNDRITHSFKMLAFKELRFFLETNFYCKNKILSIFQLSGQKLMEK